jgi:hypothetical protein
MGTKGRTTSDKPQIGFPTLANYNANYPAIGK